MISRGAFEAFPTLAEPLPKLVRKQRRLEAQIVPLAPIVEQEKAVRKDIDALLLEAGLASGDGVTCLGYDVVHRERKGQTSLNQDTLIEVAVAKLVEVALVPSELARQIITDSIAAAAETGDPVRFAEVKPSKGAKVRR